MVFHILAVQVAPKYLGLTDTHLSTIAYEVKTSSYCVSIHKTSIKCQTDCQCHFQSSYLDFQCDEQMANLLVCQSQATFFDLVEALLD